MTFSHDTPPRDLQRLTEHVWFYPPHPDNRTMQPSVGVVMTAAGTLLYDAGSSPWYARQVQAALDAVDAPPVRWLVYSHHHWDHIFGAQVFADRGAQIIGHARCDTLVETVAARPWGPDYLAERVALHPRLKIAYGALNAMMGDDWPDLCILRPHQVFETSLHRIEIGGLCIEIEHVGGAHAEDSTVLRVPDERVMFLSDSFYPPFITSEPDQKPRQDREMLARFAMEGHLHYVDGHNGLIHVGG